jgi:hypothetical protein
VRVALMAMVVEGGQPVRLSGRSLASHQLHAALAVACERIVCLAEAPGPALAAIQREAEAQGAKFHAIAHHRALAGLVSASDTLFVLAPGVLPEREWLVQALGARAGIVVLPAEGAVEQGFERIDRDRAWAGVLSTRGDAVEALATLPPDADPIAGLLRVALQRGGRCVEVPQGWLDDGRWGLLSDSKAAARVEEHWHSRHVPPPTRCRPGEVLGHRFARWLLPRSADRAGLTPMLAIGGVGVGMAGGAVGFTGHLVIGLALLALGTFISHVGGWLGRFARAGTNQELPQRVFAVRDSLLDLSLIAVAASPQQFSGWIVPFVAAVLVAAVRLAREEPTPSAIQPLGDRTLVFSVLTLAAGLGAFAVSAAGLALIGLAGRLFWPRPRG